MAGRDLDSQLDMTFTSGGVTKCCDKAVSKHVGSNSWPSNLEKRVLTSGAMESGIRRDVTKQLLQIYDKENERKHLDLSTTRNSSSDIYVGIFVG